MSVHQITLPLGYSDITELKDLGGLRAVWGDCDWMKFAIMRTSPTAVQINIKRSRPRDVCGKIMSDSTEILGGLVGDTLQLKWGEKLHVDAVTDHDVTLTLMGHLNWR